jgi:heat shock protein HslJ
MTSPRTLLVAPLLTLLALAGCGDESSGPAGGAGSDPDGTTYVVTGVTVGGEPHRLVRGSQIRLSFADGRLGISAGCNSMSGSYALQGTRLTVEPLAMTDMGCDRPLMEQDAWVAGLFEGPVQFNGESVISGDTVLTLADRRDVSPDVPLVGTTWRLDGIGAGGGPDGSVSSVPADVRVATLRITANGRAEVFDGCNRGTGPAVVDEDAGTVDLGARATTKMACPGAEEVVDAVNDVLDGLITYAITEKSLTLTNGDASLYFVAD